MTCPFCQDDAAYVLGALSPAERLDFERHLVGCEECRQAVRELAGIPGLLARVDPAVLTGAPGDEPVPDTVLPGLARAVRRSRRRRTFAAAAAAAVAAAVVSPVVVAQVRPDDSAPPVADVPVAVLTMDPVGEVPVEAELALENVTWGTRLELTCTYDTGKVAYELPPRVDYVLVVRTGKGHAERVGSWRSLDGRTMRLTAATAAPRGEITSVEVRTPDGRVVLRTA